ncbi:hypothetical protein SSX86_017360 [Deinandra increscens subsp. villosa]|uniref:Anthranilate phosphoribosyltransferase n=1 Tax=Deinandra increscens subsp. villosa TaxID=3103831 RepID=A0AAP0CUY0_9ASTR
MSAKGELKDEEEVSKAQLGAFFAAMTIRANAFPEPTQWSEGERRAMDAYWPHLIRALPSDIIFLADPEGSIMRLGNSIGPQYVGNGSYEMRLVGALREVLAGGHLGYEEVQGVLREVLPLNLEYGTAGTGTAGTVSESLLSAFFIGQRMNRETDRELKAYCLAFDDELGPSPVADVKSLTHYGEPYDGNTRFFRSTLFVAAVRSCYNEACLLHGVDWMPPKGGITEEQMLKFMGANTNITPLQAKTLLEDEAVGFAYVSQREARPSLYSLIEMREHIKKRPPLATAEKVQQYVRATGKEAIVAGFYHGGYEEPLLMLMRRRGVHAGLVVKGGITEEQMLKFMGANTNITPLQAKTLLEDEAVGFAYVSQREARPSLYSLIEMREHIKKRPPLATAEKVQQYVRATGKEAIVAGFYHGGYEEPLLMLMRRRGVHAGLVVKGEEGALSMTMKSRSINASKGLPVNYCSGFRSLNTPPAYDVDGVSRENFSFVADPKKYGFEPSDTPRTDKSVSKNIELGLAALQGEKGPAYDRIVLNAGMADHLLGCTGAEDVLTALDRARDAIDSGAALNRLLSYIKISHQVK